MTTSRHTPYTGGYPGASLEARCPAWLNDLLWEQVPGRYNATFRLEVRRWWCAQLDGNGHAAPSTLGDMQAAVLTEVMRRWREGPRT